MHFNEQWHWSIQVYQMREKYHPDFNKAFENISFSDCVNIKKILHFINILSVCMVCMKKVFCKINGHWYIGQVVVYFYLVNSSYWSVCCSWHCNARSKNWGKLRRSIYVLIAQSMSGSPNCAWYDVVVCCASLRAKAFFLSF